MYNVFVVIPRELFDKDVSKLWEHLIYKLRQDYITDSIGSNYTGEGCLEKASKVVLLYEFRDFDSCKEAVQRCKDLNIPYEYFMRYYAPNRVD